MTVYEKELRATPIEDIDWKRVMWHIESGDVSMSFIREYAGFLDWKEMSKFKHTTEFYREFGDRLRWWAIAKVGIDERKIKEFKDRWKDEYDWQSLSQHSKLSKKFIMRNTELVDWDGIFTYQEHLSDQFMIDNQNRFSDDVDIELTFQSWGIKREKSIL